MNSNRRAEKQVKAALEAASAIPVTSSGFVEGNILEITNLTTGGGGGTISTLHVRSSSWFIGPIVTGMRM
jgi:hypothetical protein